MAHLNSNAIESKWLAPASRIGPANRVSKVASVQLLNIICQSQIVLLSVSYIIHHSTSGFFDFCITFSLSGLPALSMEESKSTSMITHKHGAIALERRHKKVWRACD